MHGGILAAIQSEARKRLPRYATNAAWSRRGSSYRRNRSVAGVVKRGVLVAWSKRSEAERAEGEGGATVSRILDFRFLDFECEEVGGRRSEAKVRGQRGEGVSELGENRR